MITVLTPTYNRADKLKNLFESLCGQTNKLFKWMIIDDGSTDDTKEIVSKMILNADFRILYLYKENGGKHTALNYAVPLIESELVIIVDSDDILTKDSIETILAYHERYKSIEDICGYAFLRGYFNGKISGRYFKGDEVIDTYINVRINMDDTWADKAEVFFTKCLKEYPFPVYGKEKFLGEDIVWIRMARKYRMVHINKVIYIMDRLDEGLTMCRRKNNVKSPIGCMNRAAEFMEKDIKLKYRIKGGLQYVTYGILAGYSVNELIHICRSRSMVLLCLIPGKILAIKWKHDYC